MGARRPKTPEPQAWQRWLLEERAKKRIERRARQEVPDLVAAVESGDWSGHSAWRELEYVLLGRDATHVAERAREERRAAAAAAREQAKRDALAALEDATRARHRAQREPYERDGTLKQRDPWHVAGSLIDVRSDGLCGLTGYEMLERAQVLLEYAPESVPAIMDGLPLSDPVVTEAYERACEQRDAAEVQAHALGYATVEDLIIALARIGEAQARDDSAQES